VFIINVLKVKGVIPKACPSRVRWLMGGGSFVRNQELSSHGDSFGGIDGSLSELIG
jgi:hypothetical protein